MTLSLSNIKQKQGNHRSGILSSNSITIFSCLTISCFSSLIFLLSRPRMFAISYTRSFSSFRSSSVFIFSYLSFCSMLEYVSRSLLTLLNSSSRLFWFPSISFSLGPWFLSHLDSSSSNSLFFSLRLPIIESCFILACLRSMISCSFFMSSVSISSIFSAADFSSFGPEFTFPLLICKALYFSIRVQWFCVSVSILSLSPLTMCWFLLMSSMTWGWSLSLEQFLSPSMSSPWSMSMMRRRSARLESEWSPSNLGTVNSRVWGMYPSFSSLDLMRLITLLISPWMQSSQGALRSLHRMFFLQSMSLKNWKRKESLAALILVMARYIFSDESASSFNEFICFSKSFSIFSQFSPAFGFTLSMKFSFTTSNSPLSSVLALSQYPQKNRFTYKFLELSEVCSLLKFFMCSRETAWLRMTFSISPKECLTVPRFSMRLVSVSTFFLPFSIVLLIFFSRDVAFFSLPYIVSDNNSNQLWIRPARPPRAAGRPGSRCRT